MSLRLIAENSFWLLLDKILRLGGGLALTIWLARTVGPEGFGAFGFASAVFAIVSAIATLGLQSLVMRDLARAEESNKPRLITAAIALRLAASVPLVLIAIAAVLSARGSWDTASLLTAILVSAAIPQALDVLEWTLLAREQARIASMIRLGVFCVCAAIRVGVILGGGSLAMFAASIALEALLGMLVLLGVAPRAPFKVMLRHFRAADVVTYAKATLPLLGATLGVQIYMRADQLMVAQILGDHEAGLYAAAVRISEAWNFLPAAALIALSTRLTLAHSQSNAEFMRMLGRVMQLFTLISLAFAITVALGAAQLIALLYGDQFAAAADPLRVHVFSSVFVSMGIASGPYFMNQGLFHTAMFNTLVGGAVNLALNLVLIPHFGLLGSAYAAVASHCISALALNAMHPRTWPLARLQLSALWLPRSFFK